MRLLEFINVIERASFDDEGFWITDGGEIIKTNHARDIHHSDLLVGEFGKYMDDLWDEDGALDEHGSAALDDAASDAGWIRISAIVSPKLVIEFAQPPLPAIASLIKWIVSVPDRYTFILAATGYIDNLNKQQLLAELTNTLGKSVFYKAAEMGLGESLNEDISIPPIDYDFNKMDGFWVVEDGYIHEVDHDNEVHHTDLVIDILRGNPEYSHLYDEYGDELIDKYYNDMYDLGLELGWIRVATVAASSGNVTIVIDKEPSVKALETLILWLLHVPNYYRIDYYSSSAKVRGSKGDVLSAIETGSKAKFDKASRSALGESITVLDEITASGSLDDDASQGKLGRFDIDAVKFLDGFVGDTQIASEQDDTSTGPKLFWFVNTESDTPIGFANTSFGSNEMMKYATTSMIWIEDEYRGEGLAGEYYAWLLEDLGRHLISDTEHSPESEQVWWKLVQRYESYVNDQQINTFDDFSGAYDAPDTTIRVSPVLRKSPVTESLDSVNTHSPSQIAKKHGVDVQVIIQQLIKGSKVELEHTTDASEARTIALDHIWELPDYYSKLAGVEGSEGLEEAFDSAPSDVVPVHSPNELLRYEFTIDDNTYMIFMDGPKKGPTTGTTWEVSYGLKEPSENEYGYNAKTSPTNTGNAGKVFSTLIEFLQDFIHLHGVEHLIFTGSKDSGLASLYNRMLPYFAKRYNYEFESKQLAYAMKYTITIPDPDAEKHEAIT
jgi:hypothetical protein